MSSWRARRRDRSQPMMAEDGPPMMMGMKPNGWPLTIRSMPMPSMAPPIRPPVTPEEMPSHRMSPRVIMGGEVWGLAGFGKGWSGVAGAA